jgi:phage/plasmid-like protein (TIGR03299 family)
MVHAVENMAFVGDVPWHGLGTQISADMPLDEIQQAAGLDWDVRLEANHKADGSPIDASYYIERVSDGQILGKCVTEAYLPVQNSTMFEFFQPFVDAGSLYVHTAGSLFDGAKVWAMATPNEGFTLDGDDTVVSNLVFTLDHSGMRANSCLFSPIRVVCNNTWTLAKNTASQIVKHNHKVPFDADVMVTALGMFQSEFSRFEELAKKMAAKVLTGEEEIDFFRTVFGGKETVDNSGKVTHSIAVRKALLLARGQEYTPSNRTIDAKLKKQKLAALEQLMQEAVSAGTTTIDLSGLPDTIGNFVHTNEEAPVINAGHDLKSARADNDRITLWGAFQTVTNIIDHNPIKDTGPDKRLDAALYGGTRNNKSIALDKARELVAA